MDNVGPEVPVLIAAIGYTWFGNQNTNTIENPHRLLSATKAWNNCTPSESVTKGISAGCGVADAESLQGCGVQGGIWNCDLTMDASKTLKHISRRVSDSAQSGLIVTVRNDPGEMGDGSSRVCLTTKLFGETVLDFQQE